MIPRRSGISSCPESRAVDEVANAVLEFDQRHVHRADREYPQRVAGTLSQAEATTPNMVVRDFGPRPIVHEAFLPYLDFGDQPYDPAQLAFSRRVRSAEL